MSEEAIEKSNLTMKEAASRLDVSTETIRRMILSGELPGAYKKRPTAQTSPYVIPLAAIVAIEEQRQNAKPGSL